MTNEKANPEIISHDYEVHSSCTAYADNIHCAMFQMDPNKAKKKQQPHEQ